jgi:hypothetical protein
MIEPGVLEILRQKKPFEPLRIHLADGQVFDVNDPKKFIVMERQLFLALPKDGRWKLIPYQNIASVDTPQAA